MAFNSVHFLIFFPMVLGLAWALRGHRSLRVVFLLVASYYFYMSWNWMYAGLILGSTVLDYLVALRMEAARRPVPRRAWLILSLSGNLGVLFLFKYYNFFADSVAQAFGNAGQTGGSYHLQLLLPVGISFYTFQTLSYTIDVFRGRLRATRNFLEFALFVSFFPQLVAGPIVRASHFLPQVARPARFNDSAAERGLGLIFLGLVKKVCLADMLGVALVDPIFADPGACSSATLLLGMYGYAFQIYYDFSGYSDIAIGAARMLGFELPINFDHPYRATSMRNFWRRWHISLSTWLRDYLYIPLGGSSKGTWKTARNLAVVMLLGGLWHGAAWTFVCWGALHGLLLGAGRIFHKLTGIDADRDGQPLPSRLLRIMVTFHLAAGCFVMFRTPDITAAGTYFHTMCFGSESGAVTLSSTAWVILLVAMLLEWGPRSWLQTVARTYLRLPSPVQAATLCGCLFLVAAAGGSGTPFIYFQF
jgi:alginate O-acetyltransferase complex protein AlgI